MPKRPLKRKYHFKKKQQGAQAIEENTGVEALALAQKRANAVRLREKEVPPGRY